jgi:chemotaxis response regulator CheB
MNPKPKLTVGQAMPHYAPETKDKVSRFNRQNNKAARPNHTYRAARRALAKLARRKKASAS